MTPRERVLERIDAPPSDAGLGVCLVDILDHVDSTERWLLSHRELDDALRHLYEAGRISEVSPGRFAAHDPRPPSTPYRALTDAAYDKAVRAYRDEFADNIVAMTRQPFFQNSGSPYLDPDQVAISFVLERVVERFGGKLGDPLRRDPLEYPVAILDGADLDALAQAARKALTDRSLDHRETWLRLTGHRTLKVGGSSDIPRG